MCASVHLHTHILRDSESFLPQRDKFTPDSQRPLVLIPIIATVEGILVYRWGEGRGVKHFEPDSNVPRKIFSVMLCDDTFLTDYSQYYTCLYNYYCLHITLFVSRLQTCSMTFIVYFLYSTAFI
jgi:hypothetical protein